MKSEAELLFAQHLRELGVRFDREYHFHPTRKWRFDFVLWYVYGPIDQVSQIAIEIEGGIWSRGRHTRGKGYQEDLSKYNEAAMLGYKVLRFSTADVMSGKAKAFLAEHLGIKRPAA